MLELIIGFGFVFLILIIASLFERLHIFNDEGTRKFIHIGVSNWFILARFLFEDKTYLAIIAPLTFIVLNYLSYRYNLVSAMERDEKSVNDLGTVYYAISLTIITYFAFEYDYLKEGLFAILVMGYGDGLSAVFGKFFGKKKLYQNKSWLGTFTMFLVTMIIGLILFPELWYLMIFIALMMSMLELFTPKGLDNISVPLILFLFLVVIL